MSISVVIPLYNGGPWIRQALDSVLAQEESPEEIVVIDDGSTDDSPKLVCEYSNVKLARNSGKGSCMARNLGISLTTSPFVAFLDQDDLWHPAHLRLLQTALEQRPEASAAIATASTFDQGVPEFHSDPVELAYFDPWTRYPFTIGVDGPSLALVRRSALTAVGLWEEQSTGMGDALLFLKLASLHPLLQLSSCTVGKRVHARSQWLRVREWSGKYLGFRYKVMALALDFRRSRMPDDPAQSVFERRLGALQRLRRICEAISIGNTGDIEVAAHQLEHDLFGDPEPLFRHAFYCLMGALFPIHDSELLRAERDRVFGELLELWPVGASRTRAALQSMIGESPRVS